MPCSSYRFCEIKQESPAFKHSNWKLDIRNGSETETAVEISFRKVNFRNFFQIYEDFIKDLTRELPLRAYAFVFGKT